MEPIPGPPHSMTQKREQGTAPTPPGKGAAPGPDSVAEALTGLGPSAAGGGVWAGPCDRDIKCEVTDHVLW